MIGCIRKYAVLALSLTALASTQAVAFSSVPDKPANVSVSLGAEFASGTYGTDTTTRSLYMPLVATWSPNDRLDIGLEIPFIYQSSSQVTTSLFSGTQSTVAASSAAKGGPGGNSGEASTSTSSVSGIGDIIMRLGVIALPESNSAPMLRPMIHVKFPTASASDGLGTGEFDAGIGLEAAKWFGRLHLTGDAVYTWQGKVAGFGLKNYISYSGGIGYQLTDQFEPMLMVKGATQPSDYSSELFELRARAVWALSASTALDMYGSRGLTDSSPDFGCGVSVIYSF